MDLWLAACLHRTARAGGWWRAQRVGQVRRVPRWPGWWAPLRSEITAGGLGTTLVPQLAARTLENVVCSNGLEYPVCADIATGRSCRATLLRAQGSPLPALHDHMHSATTRQQPPPRQAPQAPCSPWLPARKKTKLVFVDPRGVGWGVQSTRACRGLRRQWLGRRCLMPPCTHNRRQVRLRP